MTGVFFATVKPLEDAALFSRLYTALPAARRAKTDRLRFDKDKRLSVAAGTLLRHALRGQGIDPDLAVLAEGPDGKPFLPAFPEFRFSLSHSGEMAMISVSGKETGCDIEAVTSGALSVAERFFAPEEIRMIREAPEAERDTLFFRLWTLKESFMKCTGRGFSMPLDSFSILPHENWERCRVACNGAPAYTLFPLRIAEGYAAAVCLAGEEFSAPEPAEIRLDAPELLM